MSRISRNSPCPCGSGKKYKRCCGAREASHVDGLTAGIRMKGGVLFDPQVGGYVPIVHSWDNIHCHGEPEEWRAPKVFPTEEEAMSYYKTYLRPELQRMMSKMKNERTDVTAIHREIDELQPYFEADMQDHSPQAKELIMKVVSNQLKSNSPPETRETLQRLVSEGYLEQEAKELIGCVVAAHIYDILKEQREFDNSKYVKDLNKLPTPPWED